MENNVVELHGDTVCYRRSDGENIDGVIDKLSGIEFMNDDEDKHNAFVNVEFESDGKIRKESLKQLCVGWLALNYPDSINWDN